MRLGVITGVHEDVVRLKQAFELLRQNGCDAIACLGDIVGYSVAYYGFEKFRDAHQAVELVKQHCRYVVAGNHDLYAVRKISTRQKVFEYPSNWYALERSARQELSQGRVWLYEDELAALLTPEDEAYLRRLPEFLPVTIDGLGIMLSHYAYPDLSGDSVSFNPALLDNLAQHLRFMSDHGCRLGFSGHDGRNGVAIYTGAERREAGFGIHALPQHQPVWIQIPWVANGTYDNGVLVLDTTHRQIEAIPLNTPPHVVPSGRNAKDL